MRSDVEHRALMAARTLVDRMRALYRELEQLTGASISMYRALLCIGDTPGLTASSLGECLGMKRPAVSQALRGMSARGWVERRRSETDQRSVRIHLTASGQRVLKRSRGRAVHLLTGAVRALRTEQLRQLAAGLEALLNQLPEQRSARARPSRSHSRASRSTS